MRTDLPETGEHDPLAQLQKINRVIMLGFLAVGLALLFWGVARAPQILAREDNPRLVEAELSIQRGRILDRNGEILALSVGQEDRPQRQYPIPGIGPAVGYYSFRHGTAGVEESYDPILRGDTADFWAGLMRQSLHQPQVGRDIQLTLDASLQARTGELMAGKTGAALLLSLPNAEILALESLPGYDPNLLDENFDELTADETAPLLNRITQGQYQPGRILQPIILAAAFDQGLIAPEELVENANEPVQVHGMSIQCSTPPPEPAVWSDVLEYACPSPLAELSSRFTQSGLEELFANFGLTTLMDIDLATLTAGFEPISDIQQAVIGQGEMAVSPIQIALAWAGLGLDGRIPIPRLVTAVQDETGEWEEVAHEENFLSTAVSPEIASFIRTILPLHENFLEFSTLVLSGPEGSINAWYLGMAPTELPRYVVVIVIEESDDLRQVESIGRALLKSTGN